MTFPTTGREQAGLDAPTGVVTCTARHKAYPWTCTLPKGHQGDHRDTEAEAPQGHVLVWGRQSTRDGYPMGQRLVVGTDVASTGNPRLDRIIQELGREVAAGDMTPARADWFRFEAQHLVRDAKPVPGLAPDPSQKFALAMHRLDAPNKWHLPYGDNQAHVLAHAVQGIADDLGVQVRITPSPSGLWVELGGTPDPWQVAVAAAYADGFVQPGDAVYAPDVDAPSSPQEAPGQAEAPILGSVGTDDGWTATTMSYRGQSWRVFRTPGTSRKWTSSILVRGEWTVYEDEAPSKASALAAAKAASEDPARYLRSVL